MKTIRLFLKGNLDLRDTLHSLRLNGIIHWNGINQIAREAYPGIRFRTYHEVMTRSDALLECQGAVPEALKNNFLKLGPYSEMAQFNTRLFNQEVDAFIFSIQPDVMTNLLRHHRDGFLLYPGDLSRYGADQLRWIKESFLAERQLDVSTFVENFYKIIVRCRENSDAPILIYNLSSAIPGELFHSYAGVDETLSLRIRRFNLGLIELSQRTGISIIDVDSIIARHGATGAMVEPMHFNAIGCRLIANEVVRTLDDLGCFAGCQ